MKINFEWTKEQLMIRREVVRLCSKFDDNYWLNCDREHRFPWEFYNAIADGGWIGVAIPEKYGGAGLGITEAAIVLNAIASTGAGMNGGTAIHLSLFGLNPVVKHGSEEMKEKYLPLAALGKLHVSFGVTEPDAGTDTTRITTFARRDGDHFIINGKKVWNSKAKESSKVLLLTRTTPLEECKRKTDGMTLFLADLDKRYVSIKEIEKLGRNAVDSNELFIEDLPVSEKDVVGEIGKGFYHLLDGLNPERILLSAEFCGLGMCALKKAVQYANERVVFGRPIGKNQAIQHPLAESYAELEAADLLWQRAAWLYDNGQPSGAAANVAKYIAAEVVFNVCDRALQTFGGFGYAKEYHVERYWREARLLKIAPVSQEMVLNYIGEHVLDLPKSY
ncbi:MULTISPECIES: acyl-CoA dehydrogenase family protein [Aneurinibacillus]|jgi:acyl-CoA dehydrogenase|uniref:Acyl-CoA dehydrogenase n=1 Tax=Aneurinibacillus danicus TaxID=267746 RepID=A0A511VDU3_9BACL|nr:MULTISPECIES: acyl-CoA dehydrogenase family protein [Aneurinibacillus]GEN35442.1 acyl-CoA dehydrogenase [Aneurinibacillus danicus]